jgi:glycosyltransferase involved in cell wall biosynthesis
MIVNVPIEPLQERYSQQWGQWFHKYLKDLDEYISICPTPMTDKVREGAFLDIVGTVHYKSEQVSQICQLIDDKIIPRNRRVVFLFHDGWFPIEQLAYIRDLLECWDWKFVGIFHDGTYDKHDLLARKKLYTWGESLENSWFKIYDKVIVGSNYHRFVLLEERQIPDIKISVIPWHVDVGDHKPEKKREQLIVFPHRLDEEKRPDVFRKLMEEVCNPKSDYRYEVTQDFHFTKDEYYNILAKAQISVSTAVLEMFGIAMVESVLLGCLPLVPDRLAYKEMYPECFRYKDDQDMRWKLTEMMHSPKEFSSQLRNLQAVFKHQSSKFFPDLCTVLKTV